MQIQCQVYDCLARSLLSICVDRKLTISFAESCTGGHLAARITKLPGCSQFFLGSIVAYSNQMKVDVLGVNQETLKSYGAVSGQVVEEMARGIMRLTQSDIAVAISGIAGPDGGSDEKPVGTIWSAIAFKNKPCVVWKSHLNGTRQEIIEKASEEILSVLIKQLTLINTTIK